MPEQTQIAVDWALQQTLKTPYDGDIPVTKGMVTPLMTLTRQYFDDHAIKYNSFTWDDLKPYVEQSLYN